jgi:glycosyltransferase involved in cell wall biosynthesis
MLSRSAGADVPEVSVPVTVGVVIRTLNESELIGKCLETLRRQRGGFDLDVVVVDSGSTDATVEIARSYETRIVELMPCDFDYSRALNVGIEQVGGDLVVLISAHAVPIGDDWLETMTAPFADARVAGVSSRQVPWPGAQWGEVHRLRHQFPEQSAAYAQANADEIVFSNSASSVRRSVWREQPFTLPISEDLDWAQRAVAAGWTIVYESRAPVYHSHHETPRAQALRMIDFNRLLHPEGHPRTRRRIVREAAGMILRDSRKIFELEEPFRRKLVYLAELTLMSYFYVIDFSKPGTVAERRRATEAPPA